MAGHTGPILKIIPLEPSKMEGFKSDKILDSAKVITASLDNTIMLWDYDKMELITKIECPKQSELTCCTFLYKSCLLATGHEDGAIRLWNLEINSSVLLKYSHVSQKHTNTISCITSTIWKESEYLICGSYDGKVSIWEISDKLMTADVMPQLRHILDNKKATQIFSPRVTDKLTVLSKLK